MARSQNITVY